MFEKISYPFWFGSSIGLRWKIPHIDSLNAIDAWCNIASFELKN